MANVEHIFNSCLLELIVPDRVLHLPDNTSSNADEWLQSAKAAGERRHAFFDERLDLFLVAHFPDPDLSIPSSSEGLLSPNALKSPPILLAILNQLQVSLEASYIPSISKDAPTISHPAPPVRTSSSGRTPHVSGLGVSYPIHPPQTPSPKPATSESDSKYAYSEGTLLKTLLWGEDSSEEEDAFRLLRSSNNKCWTALYRLSLAVVFVKTEFGDPLLCLTTAITLRDKPLAATAQRRYLKRLVEAAGPIPPLFDHIVENAIMPTDTGSEIVKPSNALEELNLLDGLSFDRSKASSNDVYFPTIRLGNNVRKSYALPPLDPRSPTSSVHPKTRALPVLRKSFRKVLGLASGFFVRMRSLIVPQLQLSGAEDGFSENSGEESTVVLSIEIENPTDSEAGFSVDSIEVSIRGETVRVQLIGWGDEGFGNPEKVFPLLIKPNEQYYLMYTVTFLRSSDTDSALQASDNDDFMKMVSFNITGRPFTLNMSSSTDLSFITEPFTSRWNCRLDLDPRRRDQAPPPTDSGPNVMPYPPSPFPISSPRTQQVQDQAAAMVISQMNITAGAKRHTFGGTTSSHLTPQRPLSLNTPVDTPTSRHSPLGKLGLKPWTVGSPVPSSTPGHLSPPLPPLPGGSPAQTPPQTANPQNYSFPTVPNTPAFPSYNNQPLTPRPNSVTPSFGQIGSIGLGIDARRERASSLGLPMTPAFPITPKARMGADNRSLSGSVRDSRGLGSANKDFIISISLVPPLSLDDNHLNPQRVIRPLDEFSLEIFVFNQSSFIRTLAVSLVDKRRRREERQDSLITDSDAWKPNSIGFTALESQVRIGPLGPSTCQSVTMRFIALSPGIHTIDGLVLTDLDLNESTNLRSVMDFAVVA